MKFSQEKILKNTKRYYETWEKYGFANEELMKFLGNDIVKAPASTMTSLHNACEGGLIDHMLKVAKYAIKLNEVVCDELKVTEESLIKVSLLHQIGKANLYKENTSEWHRKNLGKMYEFNEDLIAMSVGERSVMYALQYGIKLSDKEVQAILNYEKPAEDKQAKWFTETLGVILRQANELAIMEEKSTQKKYE